MTTLVEQRLTSIDRTASSLSVDAGQLRRTVESLYGGQQAQTERLGAIEWAAASSLALSSTYLPEIATSLAATAVGLARIEQLLANPRRAAAHERLREGLLRISRGHIPEAEIELRAAAAEYPYDPEARLALGNVLVQLGRPGEAAYEYWHAWRYNESWELAAGAALLYTAALFESNQGDLARSTLAEACELLPDSAEIWLAAGRAGIKGALSEALRRAPELILTCRDDLARLAELRSASLEVLDSGALSACQDGVAMFEDAIRAARALGVATNVQLPSLPPETDPAARLAWCVVAATELDRFVGELSDAVRAQRENRPATVATPPKEPSKAGAWWKAFGAGAAVLGLLVVIGVSSRHFWIVGLWVILSPLVAKVTYDHQVSASAEAAKRTAEVARERATHELLRAEAPFNDLLTTLDEIRTRVSAVRPQPRPIPRLA